MSRQEAVQRLQAIQKDATTLLSSLTNEQKQAYQEKLATTNQAQEVAAENTTAELKEATNIEAKKIATEAVAQTEAAKVVVEGQLEVATQNEQVAEKAAKSAAYRLRYMHSQKATAQASLAKASTDEERANAQKRIYDLDIVIAKAQEGERIARDEWRRANEVKQATMARLKDTEDALAKAKKALEGAENNYEEAVKALAAANEALKRAKVAVEQVQSVVSISETARDRMVHRVEVINKAVENAKHESVAQERQNAINDASNLVNTLSDGNPPQRTAASSSTGPHLSEAILKSIAEGKGQHEALQTAESQVISGADAAKKKTIETIKGAEKKAQDLDTKLVFEMSRIRTGKAQLELDKGSIEYDISTGTFRSGNQKLTVEELPMDFKENLLASARDAYDKRWQYYQDSRAAEIVLQSEDRKKDRNNWQVMVAQMFDPLLSEEERNAVRGQLEEFEKGYKEEIELANRALKGNLSPDELERWGAIMYRANGGALGVDEAKFLKINGLLNKVNWEDNPDKILSRLQKIAKDSGIPMERLSEIAMMHGQVVGLAAKRPWLLRGVGLAGGVMGSFGYWSNMTNVLGQEKSGVEKVGDAASATVDFSLRVAPIIGTGRDFYDAWASFKKGEMLDAGLNLTSGVVGAVFDGIWVATIWTGVGTVGVPTLRVAAMTALKGGLKEVGNWAGRKAITKSLKEATDIAAREGIIRNIVQESVSAAPRTLGQNIGFLGKEIVKDTVATTGRIIAMPVTLPLKAVRGSLRVGAQGVNKASDAFRAGRGVGNSSTAGESTGSTNTMSREKTKNAQKLEAIQKEMTAIDTTIKNLEGKQTQPELTSMEKANNAVDLAKARAQKKKLEKDEASIKKKVEKEDLKTEEGKAEAVRKVETEIQNKAQSLSRKVENLENKISSDDLSIDTLKDSMNEYQETVKELQTVLKQYQKISGSKSPDAHKVYTGLKNIHEVELSLISTLKAKHKGTSSTLKELEKLEAKVYKRMATSVQNMKDSFYDATVPHQLALHHMVGGMAANEQRIKEIDARLEGIKNLVDPSSHKKYRSEVEKLIKERDTLEAKSGMFKGAFDGYRKQFTNDEAFNKAFDLVRSSYGDANAGVNTARDPYTQQVWRVLSAIPGVSQKTSTIPTGDDLKRHLTADPVQKANPDDVEGSSKGTGDSFKQSKTDSSPSEASENKSTTESSDRNGHSTAGNATSDTPAPQPLKIDVKNEATVHRLQLKDDGPYEVILPDLKSVNIDGQMSFPYASPVDKWGNTSVKLDDGTWRLVNDKGEKVKVADQESFRDVWNADNNGVRVVHSSKGYHIVGADGTPIKIGNVDVFDKITSTTDSGDYVLKITQGMDEGFIWKSSEHPQKSSQEGDASKSQSTTENSTTGQTAQFEQAGQAQQNSKVAEGDAKNRSDSSDNNNSTKNEQSQSNSREKVEDSSEQNSTQSSWQREQVGDSGEFYLKYGEKYFHTADGSNIRFKEVDSDTSSPYKIVEILDGSPEKKLVIINDSDEITTVEQIPEEGVIGELRVLSNIGDADENGIRIAVDGEGKSLLIGQDGEYILLEDYSPMKFDKIVPFGTKYLAEKNGEVNLLNESGDYFIGGAKHYDKTFTNVVEDGHGAYIGTDKSGMKHFIDGDGKYVFEAKFISTPDKQGRRFVQLEDNNKVALLVGGDLLKSGSGEIITTSWNGAHPPDFYGQLLVEVGDGVGILKSDNTLLSINGKTSFDSGQHTINYTLIKLDSDDTNMVVIDKNGEIVKSSNGEVLYVSRRGGVENSSGMSIVLPSGTHGIIFRNGQVFSDSSIKDIYYGFNDGFTLQFKTDPQWGYINSEGQVLQAADGTVLKAFDYRSYRGEGVSTFEVQRGKWNIMDINGKFLENSEGVLFEFGPIKSIIESGNKKLRISLDDGTRVHLEMQDGKWKETARESGVEGSQKVNQGESNDSTSSNSQEKSRSNTETNSTESLRNQVLSYNAELYKDVDPPVKNGRYLGSAEVLDVVNSWDKPQVAFIDVDNLGTVNQHLGREGTDKFLQAFVTELQGKMGSNPKHLISVGGDEFNLLVNNQSSIDWKQVQIDMNTFAKKYLENALGPRYNKALKEGQFRKELEKSMKEPISQEALRMITDDRDIFNASVEKEISSVLGVQVDVASLKSYELVWVMNALKVVKENASSHTIGGISLGVQTVNKPTNGLEGPQLRANLDSAETLAKQAKQGEGAVTVDNAVDYSNLPVGKRGYYDNYEKRTVELLNQMEDSSNNPEGRDTLMQHLQQDPVMPHFYNRTSYEGAKEKLIQGDSTEQVKEFVVTVNRFGSLNEALGYEGANKYMENIAQSFNKEVPEASKGNIVAGRTGGGEFKVAARGQEAIEAVERALNGAKLDAILITLDWNDTTRQKGNAHKHTRDLFEAITRNTKNTNNVGDLLWESASIEVPVLK